MRQKYRVSHETLISRVDYFTLLLFPNYFIISFVKLDSRDYFHYLHLAAAEILVSR